ncbi:MAG: hypothetical protein WC735_02720 [Candidatus Paceibacterota bacterium]|jgi:hypothetical protein
MFKEYIVYIKNKNSLNGGYIGLLLLMIGLVIIFTFIIRTDLFTGDKDGKNIIEKGQDAIDRANEVKTNLENNYRFDPEAAEKIILDEVK